MSINIVMLPELTANINQIYFDKIISAILTDILGKCDGDYNYDFVPEGLRIYQIGELYAYPELRIASNIAQEYAPDYRGNVSHSISIEEMKNSVKVTSEKDSVYTELMVRQNRELIDKYGFLQKIVKIDPEKENAETIAKQELNDNAREKWKRTVLRLSRNMTAIPARARLLRWTVFGMLLKAPTILLWTAGITIKWKSEK